MLRSRPTASRTQVELTEALGTWTTAWDDLVLHAPIPTPFLRSWWLEAIASSRSRYLLVFAGDVLIGGLALEVSRLAGITVYRFAGTGRLCPDHLDVVADPDHRAEVVEAVRAWFTSRGTRLLDATGLVADSLLAAAITSATPRKIDVAPYEPLTDADAYARGRSGTFRRNVRRRAKQLTEHGVCMGESPAGDCAGALTAFAALHDARDDRTELMAEWPRLRSALAAGVQCGEVQLHLARTPEAVVAVTVCFAVGGRLALYQNARSLDRRYSGMGTVLDYAAICAAADAGMHEADMLRGAEDYKWHYVTQQRGIYRLTAAHGARAQALRAGLGALRAAARLRRHAGDVRRAGSVRRGTLHAAAAK